MNAVKFVDCILQKGTASLCQIYERKLRSNATSTSICVVKAKCISEKTVGDNIVGFT